MVKELDSEKVKEVREQQRKRAKYFGHEGEEERLKMLQQMKSMLINHEARWLSALKKDLGKPAMESYASEIALLLNELDYVMNHLSTWMKPATKKRLLLSGKETTVLTAEPFGSVLVFSPWNYPLQLALMPVIGALAAGNGVVLKPSEFAPAVSHLLNELVVEYFPKEVFFVIEGNSAVAQALTNMEWDFIFFTGSQTVGKKVYQAAAQHLTPVVMELGGKNPCIVDESGMNEETIKEIAWGKFLNAGQTCIAPDSVYVPRKYYREFLQQMKAQITSFYGKQPMDSPDYGRIVHQDHLEKLLGYLDGGTIYKGGQYSIEENYLSPTLMIDIPKDHPLHQEEIFGPILPVIPYDSLDEVIEQYKRLPVPLVVYLFSEDTNKIEKIERALESGALSVNHVLVHLTNPEVPFGGKGKSGFGNYHGKASFDTFTYQRAHYQKKMPFKQSEKYPPYSNLGLKVLRKFRRKIF